MQLNWPCPKVIPGPWQAWVAARYAGLAPERSTGEGAKRPSLRKLPNLPLLWPSAQPPILLGRSAHSAQKKPVKRNFALRTSTATTPSARLFGA